MVLTCGEDDGIDGRVVVDRGDILLPFKQYVQEPIEFVIEAGRITDIGGDGYQAELVRQYIADFDDPGRVRALATSAGGSTSAPSGRRSRPTAAATAWSSVPSTATCSSRPGRTISSAGRTTRAATSTSRCATAASSSTIVPVIVDGEVVVDAMRPAGASVAV